MLEDRAQTWHWAGDTDLQLSSTQMALNTRGEGDVPLVQREKRGWLRLGTQKGRAHKED